MLITPLPYHGPGDEQLPLSNALSTKMCRVRQEEGRASTEPSTESTTCDISYFCPELRELAAENAVPRGTCAELTKEYSDSEL